MVVGRDTIPPTLSISLSPSILWPPNHELVPIQATITAEDACFQVSTYLMGITSSEPDDGLGDGDVGMDIQVREKKYISLRAERSGLGPGRVYTIKYRADEARRLGSSTLATATVVVPHSAP